MVWFVNNNKNIDVDSFLLKGVSTCSTQLTWFFLPVCLSICRPWPCFVLALCCCDSDRFKCIMDDTKTKTPWNGMKSSRPAKQSFNMWDEMAERESGLWILFSLPLLRISHKSVIKIYATSGWELTGGKKRPIVHEKSDVREETVRKRQTEREEEGPGGWGLLSCFISNSGSFCCCLIDISSSFSRSISFPFSSFTRYSSTPLNDVYI